MSLLPPTATEGRDKLRNASMSKNRARKLLEVEVIIASGVEWFRVEHSMVAWF
jgi:hypothetical protein